MPNQVKVNAMSFALLVKEMLAGEYTCAELAERTGLHYVTVLRYAREMHKAGSAHICAWRMNDKKQYTLKVYKIGEANDAQKLRRNRTGAERTAKYRRKQRALAQSKQARDLQAGSVVGSKVV